MSNLRSVEVLKKNNGCHAVGWFTSPESMFLFSSGFSNQYCSALCVLSPSLPVSNLCVMIFALPVPFSFNLKLFFLERAAKALALFLLDEKRKKKARANLVF